MIYFFAEYNARQSLLEMGAKWDFDRFMWCVEDPADYHKFSQWLLGNIVSDKLYILETAEVCPFCKSRQKVFAIGCGEYSENFINHKFGENSINILYGLEHIPACIEKYIRGRFKIRERYSPAFGYEHPLNGCSRCNEVFPDAYLFDDDESPFYVDSEEKGKALKIHELDLGEDVAFYGMVKWSIGNNLFALSKRTTLEKDKVFEYREPFSLRGSK